ncbi:MAG: hypothetical protein NTW96_01670 [Planctomycetia bacterium]|nr:hypothetical protein [Planctomycetia bacterium]
MNRIALPSRRLFLGLITGVLLAAASLAGASDETRSLRLTLPEADGRTVFRNIETIRLEAELAGGAAAGPWRAEVRGPDQKVAKQLPDQTPIGNKAAWTVDLAGLEPGPYQVAVSTADGGPTATLAIHILERPGRLDFFPVVAQFSPVASGKGWKGEAGPVDEATLRATVDNLREHGFTGLAANTHRPPDEAARILNYAQAQGMIVTHEVGGLELFGRDAPPTPCVYSPEYAKQVRVRAEEALKPLAAIPRLYNVFTFQDEPFHAGSKSFGYNEEVRAEFKRRYGYDLPPDLDSIRDKPKEWLDVINFRSDNFPDGWRQTYKIIKQLDPTFKTILTHDSHNTFGAGYSSHSELAIDDVFHWGGDFADMFVFDIYPYMMFDFRFGQPAKTPKPRISQTHYAFAQMRNLTRAHGKDLGFWFGTYNRAWFKDYMGPELQAKYWAEREMTATAVAQGANFLLTGYQIPEDARHWESLGEGLRLIQKAGPALLDAPKVKARACMLFPRTAMIQLQEEYFNVGLSYELFLRAFGELDILHEEQVTDDALDGYRVLVLFDVKLLPAKVAERIAAFVDKGGLVIADCVPGLDELRRPMTTMEELFGVKEAGVDRILRAGHYVPRVTGGPYWTSPPGEPQSKTDTLRGTVLGQPLDLTLVSPRPCKLNSGDNLLSTASGQPGVVYRRVGKGHAFLLGFCLQDTYFKTWEDDQPAPRGQLQALLGAITRQAGVRPHVWSSNPDVEAAIRASASEGFLFIINHEAPTPETTVRLADLGFPIVRIVNLADDTSVPLAERDGAVELSLSVPLGETRLLRVLPQ